MVRTTDMEKEEFREILKRHPKFGKVPDFDNDTDFFRAALEAFKAQMQEGDTPVFPFKFVVNETKNRKQSSDRK